MSRGAESLITSEYTPFGTRNSDPNQGPLFYTAAKFAALPLADRLVFVGRTVVDATSPYSVLGVVDGAGELQIMGGVAYTWSTRPAAAGRAGQVIRVSDIGATGAGSHWISDGTNWRPVNGSVVICNLVGSLATPLESKTGATSGSFTTLVAASKIPAEVLVPGSSSIAVQTLWNRVGATATAIAAVNIGTAGTSSDSNVYALTYAATTLFNLISEPILSAAESGRLTSSNWVSHGGSGGAAAVDRTTNINTAADMYVTPNYSSANAADTFQIIAHKVTVFS
jgi:hypothetical protein